MYKNGNTYYAFISYNHMDVKWAKWLQRRLETYRLPVTLRRDNRNLPKKLFPIGRDQTDASSGVVWDVIRPMLDDSNYLIVICSPNSAHAEWVGNEIRYFRETGRWDRIIPFIVDGKPHSTDPEKECFNDELLKFPDQDILGASIAELGKRKAVLRVIAKMLNLRFDELVMRDKQRLIKQRAVAGVCAAAALGGLLRFADYIMPHTHYYYSFTLKHEIPVGKNELTASERKKVDYCYKIVTQYDGQIQRMERVNSKGTVVDWVGNISFSEPAITEFNYDSEGRLIRTIYKNISGEEVFSQNYSINLDAVDFIWPENDRLAYFLPDDISFGALPQDGIYEYSEKSTITRAWLTYDDEDRLVLEQYRKNSGNQPAADANGIYSRQYEYNDSGMVQKVTNLGSDEQPLRMQHGSAIAFEYYTYDDKGRTLSTSFYDADMNPIADRSGISAYENEYDTAGRLICQKCMDKNKELCVNSYGYASANLEYDDNGFAVSEKYTSSDGNPAYNIDGYCGVKYVNDKNGHMIQCDYIDENDKMVYTDKGYASVKLSYDSKNRITSILYYGTDGNPAIDYQSATSGYAADFNDFDHTETYTYYDESKKPVVSKYGQAAVRMIYNDSGKPSEIQYLGADGKPIRARNNFAAQKLEYDYNGRTDRISYYDENGEPCYNRDGISSVKYKYDPNGFISSECAYDAEGEPTWRAEKINDNENFYYFEKRTVCNELGQILKISYYSPKGYLVNQNNAASEIKMEYDDSGNEIKREYYNAFGELTERVDGIACTETGYDANGNCLRRIHKDINGNYVQGQPCILDYNYNEKGSVTSTGMYIIDSNGDSAWTFELNDYDEENRLTAVHTCDKNGYLVPNENGIAETVYTYDRAGNMIKTERYDEYGKYFGDGTSEKTAAVVEVSYENTGIFSQEQILYSADDRGSIEPVLQAFLKKDKYGNYAEYSSCPISGSPAFSLVHKYNAMGDLLQRYKSYSDGSIELVREWEYTPDGRQSLISYFDNDGNLMTRQSGKPAYEETQYNEKGIVCSVAYYDEQGKPFTPHDADGAKIIYEINKNGRMQSERFSYDEDGKLISHQVNVPYISDLTEENSYSPMLRQYVLELGNWCFFNNEGYNDIDTDEIYAQLSNNDPDTSEMIGAVPMAMGNWMISAMRFPNPLDETDIAYTWYPVEVVDLIKAKYNNSKK